MKFSDLSSQEKMDALVKSGKVDKEFAIAIKKADPEELKQIIYRLFTELNKLAVDKENHAELKKAKQTVSLISSGFSNVKKRITKQIEFIGYEADVRKAEGK